jgi:hypothetical protein
MMCGGRPARFQGGTGQGLAGGLERPRSALSGRGRNVIAAPASSPATAVSTASSAVITHSPGNAVTSMPEPVGDGGSWSLSADVAAEPLAHLLDGLVRFGNAAGPEDERMLSLR